MSKCRSNVKSDNGRTEVRLYIDVHVAVYPCAAISARLRFAGEYNTGSFSIAMTPERWKDIERLYHAALTRHGETRAAFLAKSCAGDDALLREVESLLARAASAEDFLDDQALALAAHAASGGDGVMLTGRRVGAYVVEEPLGAGGMGEVYRARDTRLGRDVALKVLPADFALDAERRARFEREARVLAALNHPHIGAIYGFEESEDVRAIVLELVEGDTLARRIQRGALPINEALTIARQIADALDAAHERGIVHRDLKPANIKITPDGVVKVLDFGLAKAVVAEDASSGLSQSPTITVDGTRKGIVLGTAAYMSPEQARGQAVDKRTDIWAFGCVLYEMITGRVAFAGATVSDTIAAILEREPNWTALPAATPHPVRRLLQRCLEKDARRRLRDIADASAIVADDVSDRVSAPAVTRSKIPWVVASIAAAALAGIFAWPRQNEPRSEPVRFTFEPPESVTLVREGLDTAVSPDGRQIAFVAIGASGPAAIWLRDMDSQESRRLEGTDDAIGPFWSPDGQFLGFFAQGKLKKIAVAGGPPQNLCTTTPGLGATWSQTGEIVFNPINRAPLMRVSASGGTPQLLTTLDASRHENSHRWPSFLPDGRHFLFTARGNEQENTAVYVGSVDSNEITRLLTEQSNAVYAPPGYLLFGRQGTLMAQRFDAEKIRLAGEAFPVFGNIDQETPSANTFFSVSKNGRVIAFHEASRSLDELTWFDRNGKMQGTVGPKGLYGWPRISPDGRRLAVWMPNPEDGNRDVWTIDVGTGTSTRVTSNPANDWLAEWSAEGAYLSFTSDRTPRPSVYRKMLSGNREEELLTGPVDTGSQRLFSSGGGNYSDQLGRWVAYQSAKSGALEIYVRSLDHPDEYRISTMGGAHPRWRQDGKELFYETPDNGMIGAAITLGESVKAGAPKLLFQICSARRSDSRFPDYDVTPDGNRFLFSCQAQDNRKRAITVAIQWLDMVKDPRRQPRL